VTLREEHWLRIFENRVLRKIFRPNENEMTVGGGGNKGHCIMRTFISSTFCRVKEDEVDRACSTHE
jgi:hypothetical protein